MPHSRMSLAGLVLISAALATTPASARSGGGFGGGGGFHGGGGGGFHGGGGFGGGGFHGGGFGGGRAFSAPHFSAPRISAPHFAPRISAPRISVPHSAPRIAVPRVSAPRIARPAIHTPSIAPQRFARPVQPQHPVSTGSISPSGRTLAAPAPRMQHLATPNSATPNSAGRAFALAGAHAAAGGHILRNQFFAKRPAFAHATFQGRFARLPWWRHHRHFRPIVIGWFGPLFWPFGFDDFLGYTFYPYAYDAFWPSAYDDTYDGLLGAYGAAGPAAYATNGAYPATNRQVTANGGRAPEHRICSGQTAGVTDFQIDEIARVVEPNDAQRASLDELRTAMARALDILKAACPTELASTPTGRIEAMQARLSAMLEAVRTVRAPLAQFNALLSDEQKARFNSLGKEDEQNDPQARRELTQACSERAAGIAGLPIERIERAVRPDETQRGALADLRNAISQAGELLKSNCPTYQPLTPVVRLEAMEQRLDAMLRAVEAVRPALMNFYGSLGDEQKERFNRLSPAQS